MDALTKRQLARMVWQMLPGDKRRASLVLLGMQILGTALEVLGVGLVVPVVAVLVQPDLMTGYPQLDALLARFGSPSHESMLVGALVALASVYLIKALYLGFLGWWQMRFVYSVFAEISECLFHIYLHQPYTFHLQRNSAQLIRNAMTEVSIFTGNVLIPGMNLLTEGLLLMGIVGLLLAIEPVGALAVGAVLVLGAVGFLRLTHKYVAHWGKERQHHEGARLQHLQQGLGGAKDVKVLGREAQFLAMYRTDNRRFTQAVRRQVTLQNLPRLGLEVAAVVGLIGLVLVLLLRDSEPATVVPTIALFTAAAFRLLPSVNRILGALQAIKFGMPAVEVLQRELSLGIPVDTRGASLEKPRATFSQSIVLENITFSYPGSDARALEKISIIIRKGEAVGLCGPSGVGKTTLVDIILGLLTPEKGVVQVDGEDVQPRLREWQDQIGYVPQVIFLSDDSLRNNIAFGIPSDAIDENAIRRAIEAAQMEDLVRKLPAGLDTVVGERGIRLSGGQRQRIGIARALYHDPALLVFDEATNSLDNETERGVMAAVQALHGIKTVLIVAHRYNTVAYCDRIYVLRDGLVAEEKLPQCLLAREEEAQAEGLLGLAVTRS